MPYSWFCWNSLDRLERKPGGMHQSHTDKAARQSSPRAREVAFIPFPANFAPLPTQAETGVATDAQWALPPSMQLLQSRTIVLRILSLLFQQVASARHPTKATTAKALVEPGDFPALWLDGFSLKTKPWASSFANFLWAPWAQTPKKVPEHA